MLYSLFLYKKECAYFLLVYLCGTPHRGHKPIVHCVEIVACHGNQCFKELIVGPKIMEGRVAKDRDLPGMCCVPYFGQMCVQQQHDRHMWRR